MCEQQAEESAAKQEARQRFMAWHHRGGATRTKCEQRVFLKVELTE